MIDTRATFLLILASQCGMTKSTHIILGCQHHESAVSDQAASGISLGEHQAGVLFCFWNFPGSTLVLLVLWPVFHLHLVTVFINVAKESTSQVRRDSY